MASVNLLPEELRKLEQKEIKKVSSHPKVTRIDLSAPERPNVAVNETDRQPSWWQRIFGVEAKPKSALAVSSAMAPAPANASVDMMDSARRERIQFDQLVAQASTAPAKTAKIGKGSGKWRWPVGRHTAVTLNFSVEHDAPTTPAKWQASTAGTGAAKHQARELSSNIVGVANPKTDHRPASLTVTPPTDSPIGEVGWLAILHSLFMPKSHSRPSHLTHDVATRSTMPKPMPKPAVAPMKSAPPVAKPAPAKAERVSAADQASGHGFNINLIPEELLIQKHWGPVAYTIGFIVAVILPLVIIGGSYLLITQEQDRFDRQIALSETNIAKLGATLADYRNAQKRDDSWYDRLVAVDKLLTQHIYWSPFFTALEKYTLDGVQFGALSADTSGALILPATARDYDTAVRQIVAMRQAKDFVSKVDVSGIQLQTAKNQGAIGVSFDLKIVLVDDIFTKKQ